MKAAARSMELENLVSDEACNIKNYLNSISKDENNVSRNVHNLIDLMHPFYFGKEYDNSHPWIKYPAECDRMHPGWNIINSFIFLTSLKPTVVLDEITHYSIFYEYAKNKNREINADDIAYFSVKLLKPQHVFYISMVNIILPDEFEVFMEEIKDEELKKTEPLKFNEAKKLLHEIVKFDYKIDF